MDDEKAMLCLLEEDAIQQFESLSLTQLLIWFSIGGCQLYRGVKVFIVNIETNQTFRRIQHNITN